MSDRNFFSFKKMISARTLIDTILVSKLLDDGLFEHPIKMMSTHMYQNPKYRNQEALA